MINYKGCNLKVGRAMSRNSANKSMLAIMVSIGALGGSILGEILGNKFVFLDFFTRTYTIGTPKNLFFDLKIINLTFGINFYVNLMTIIGVILAIIVYKRY